MIAQREVVLDANHPVSYKTIYETINAWAGTSYKGYQRGYWDTSEKFWFWFPKLAVFNNGTFKPAYKDDFINTLSKDGCEWHKSTSTFGSALMLSCACSCVRTQ